MCVLIPVRGRRVDRDAIEHGNILVKIVSRQYRYQFDHYSQRPLDEVLGVLAVVEALVTIDSLVPF